MTTLRYALIGTGQMGRGHIGCLQGLDGVELVAFADPHTPNIEAALDALGRTVPTYADFTELIDREHPDAVIVATPDDTHADIACEVLRRGVHVLAEKPMATTWQGIVQLRAAAEASSAIYQVGLELRYLAIFKKVRAMIEAGAIGSVRQLWCKEFRGPWMRKVGEWITQQDRTGGALVEKDCHHFDLFNWFVGQPAERVAGFGTVDLVYGAEHFGGVTPTVLDNAQVVVQYAGGAVATLLLNMYCTGRRGGLELGIIGTDGWLIVDCDTVDTLTYVPRGGTEQHKITFELPPEIRQKSHGGAVYLEHEAFRDNILNGTHPLTDAEVAWWSTAVPLAAEQAIQERRVIELADVIPAR